MHGIGFAILAAMSAVALLVMLMWPSKRKELPRPTVPQPASKPIEE